MSLLETRQMNIEFERRVQIILPATEYQYKLDTETIESFLNQYQIQYVLGLINSSNNTELPDAVRSRLDSILARTATLKSSGEPSYGIPNDFLAYISSKSNIVSTYKENAVGSVPNKYVTPAEFLKLSQNNPYDQLRILRNPIVTILDKNPQVDSSEPLKKLQILCDRYTGPITSIDMYYYAMPDQFSVLQNKECVLPIECFDDLVSGAVELYMKYVRGGIRQQEEDGRRERAAQRAAQREDEQNRRNNKEEQQ